MKSDLPKVVHPVLGVPMIEHVVRTARRAGMQRLVAVVGHGRDRLTPLLDSLEVPWVVQEQQLGTAHAVSIALENESADEVVVLLGDVPLLETATVERLLDRRRSAQAALGVLTSEPDDPGGYGRVICDDGEILRIVEERDASREELLVGEINTGLMCFDGNVLEEVLPKIGNDNSQGEYYLTESVSIARDLGLRCVPVKIADWREGAGINDLFQLAEATDHLRRKVLERLMDSGVRFVDPWGCWIEDGVSVEEEAVIGKLVRLSGRTTVGRGARIGDFSSLRDAEIPAFARVDPFTVLGPCTDRS